MPEISRFLGIVITMYFNDHNPAALSCATGFSAIIGIDLIAEGVLPPRVLGLVVEWAEMHKPNWRRTGRRSPTRVLFARLIRSYEDIECWVTDAKALPEYRLWLRFSTARKARST